jgi:tetratricopeptide (TPR) repeat protein
MTRFCLGRGLLPGLLSSVFFATATAVSLTLAPSLLDLAPSAHAADTVRAEVGKPLQEAQKLSAAGKHKEALARLRATDGVKNKTAFELYQIDYVRGAAAAASGDHATAAKSFEAVVNANRLPAAQVPKFIESLAGMYYRAKDWPKAIFWINRSLKEGESAPMRALLIQTYYVSGNEAAAASQLSKQSNPTEAQLQMLASIQTKQGDKAGYVATLEKLARGYPKASYWADLLGRVSGKPGFSNRLDLDLQRLKLANGLLTKPAQYMEMGQLALLAGNPAEALKVIDLGYKSGALGSGPDAARHQRLKTMALKNQAASTASAALDQADLIKNKNADGLAALGLAMVSDGKADQGLALMQQALKMTSLKYPNEAKLHLGIAYANAGKKSNAIAAWKTVQGTDGASDLARYWIMQTAR